MGSGILDWIASKQYTTDQIQQKLADYAYNTNNIEVMRKTTKGNYLEYTKDNKDVDWEDVTDPEAVYYDIYQIFKPEVIDYFKGKTVSSSTLKKMQAMESALNMNNLVKWSAWELKHPMFVFHSKRDEVVPFSNYKYASRFLTNNYFKGLMYDTDTYTHVGTGRAFYAADYESDYVEAILDNDIDEYAHDTRIYGILF